ncbi:MAG: hypothetical protein C5B51_20235 [Terriglobia bacterium]|nr:MAG: hypothetical protein C5B51_20235 [Terriglobia bacterium]
MGRLYRARQSEWYGSDSRADGQGRRCRRGLSSGRVPLEASRPKNTPGLQPRDELPRSQILSATILVRRRRAAEAEQQVASIMRGEAAALSREQAAEILGADPADIELVRRFAESYGLAVTESSAAQHTVKVAGTAAQMEVAFGTRLFSCAGHACYEGPLTIPSELDRIIVGVLGLDERPIARR